MSEPKQVPEEIKKEAVNLGTERLQAQVMEGVVMIHELMAKADVDSKIGMLLTNALVEIANIKGSPPIQVAMTIARRAIDEGSEIVKKFYVEHYNANPDENIPAAQLPDRPEEHEA